MESEAPGSSLDRVIELYMRDVDLTLIRRNLSLSPQQRVEQLQELARFADELRRAGKAQRSEPTA